MKKYKRVVFFEIGRESKPLEKMKKSTWKTIIKEKSEERMNREIQQKTTTMKKFLRGTHANESQYVKYCRMEETTKLLRLRLNMIKFDSNYGKRGTCKICQKVAETMEHMLECKEAKKIIGGITGSETIMSENKEELMTIYNYMEIIFKTLK